jgi:hypothetical protein
MLFFAEELEKLSAKTIPIKGAKGRHNVDGIATVSNPLPEPEGSVPKVKRKSSTRKTRSY